MKINLKDLILNTKTLKAGQKILLSGIIYTARDAAHKRIIDILDSGKEVPFNLKNAAIYYCGPTPAKPGNVIGVCGPTTSSRMDVFTPRILKEGVKFLIGKGTRSETVVNSIKETGSVYLVATGGIAALLSKTVKKASLIAFEDLGPEAIYKLEVENMPLIVAIDSLGGDIFRVRSKLLNNSTA
ncbi:MAG: FumA C-terminus/TtdB family hydratase beta subunit [Endomicrobium sp.]|jgi:fumarate hydratase subunit beta|nr:FumA C-terminus/TtdB family hydratase beta subunit [Endomicrobium sp.]